MKYALLPIAALFPLALAQASDGISVPVSRVVSLSADEASFTLVIAAGLDSTAQQVKQALQTAGLPNPTVVATGLGSGASAWFDVGAQILYSATAAIPAGSALDTAKTIDKLRTNPPAPLTSLQYSVAFNPSQAAVDAARQATIPLLLEDARKAAQTVAAAAGVKVGAIRSISDAAGLFLYVPTAVERNGDFSQTLNGSMVTSVRLGSAPIVAPYSYSFSLTVVFDPVP